MIKVILKTTGEVLGTFEGLTSSPNHGWMRMGVTVVRFRGASGIAWELPWSECGLA
jgi:hypothetical protein